MKTAGVLLAYCAGVLVAMSLDYPRVVMYPAAILSAVLVLIACQLVDPS